jgi:exonuclease SbcD
MIKVLHLSDIHLGSSFSHGKINPKTGFNTRLEDFIHCLNLCMESAIDNSVDLVLFGGDAFPDSTPAPYIQEAFASQFRRLADGKIPTVLLVGNHDQHSHGHRAASLSIYRTLGVPHFQVGDKPETHRISTKSGDVQVLTLPWLNRSGLLTREESEGLSMEEIHQLLIEKVEQILEGEVRRLDPNIPTILLAHLMAERCSLGAERYLAVGKGFNFPLSLLIRPEFDYVALGHVHKHQNLNPKNNPPVIYPGSIERVDFSEEEETKGYVMVELEKGKVNWEFCPLPARPFCTIEVDVSDANDPQAKILEKISAHSSPGAKKNIKDAVVRLIYKLRSEQLELININELHKVLEIAHHYTIRAELVSQLSRPRLPEFGVGNSLDPMEALAVYLKNRQDIQDLESEMLSAARNLLDKNTDNLSVSINQNKSTQMNNEQLTINNVFIIN